jgi:hypothetical protein
MDIYRGSESRRLKERRLKECIRRRIEETVQKNNFETSRGGEKV